jgi:hypothetical protein
MDKETVDRCRKEADAAYLVYREAKRVFEEAQFDYLKKVRRFRSFDYELALKDGRLKKIPPSGIPKEKKKQPLTIEQLKNIAEKLGINLSAITAKPDSEITEILEENNVQEEESTLEVS